MKRYLVKALLPLLVLVSCRAEPPIPAAKMAEIYYDIFLTDQYLDLNPEVRTAADSMAVYPALFARYGYTVDEFMEALAYYRARPEQFSSFIQDVKARLRAEADDMEQYRRMRDSLDTEEPDAEEIQWDMDSDDSGGVKMMAEVEAGAADTARRPVKERDLARADLEKGERAERQEKLDREHKETMGEVEEEEVPAVAEEEAKEVRVEGEKQRRTRPRRPDIKKLEKKFENK